MRRLAAVSAVTVGLALTGCENSVDPPADTGAAAQEDTAVGEGDSTSEEATAGDATDTGAMDTETTDPGATDSGATDTEAGVADADATDGGTGMTVTDEMMNRVQTQFPALAALVPEQQMRDLVSQACGAVESGGVETAQMQLQERFNVDAAMAQQVADWLDQNVCAA